MCQLHSASNDLCPSIISASFFRSKSTYTGYRLCEKGPLFEHSRFIAVKKRGPDTMCRSARTQQFCMQFSNISFALHFRKDSLRGKVLKWSGLRTWLSSVTSPLSMSLHQVTSLTRTFFCHPITLTHSTLLIEDVTRDAFQKYYLLFLFLVPIWPCRFILLSTYEGDTLAHSLVFFTR